jgi:tetratricopeptide (TPR) repeat protein
MRVATYLLTAALIGACSPAARARGMTVQQPDIDRGIDLYNSGEYQEAVRILEPAAGGNARGLTYLGLSRLQLQQHAPAEEAFRKALEIDPNYAQAHYGLGLALGYLGQRDKAIESLQKAVDIDPQNAYAHYHLALGLNQSGAKDRAILHLQRFLDLLPDAPEAPQVRQLLSQLR